MGWDFDGVSTGRIPEKRLCSLIGEGLDLGCLGTVLYLVFLSSGPWWVEPRMPDSIPVAVLDVSAAGVSSESGSVARPKKQRRTGCLPMPASLAQ